MFERTMPYVHPLLDFSLLTPLQGSLLLGGVIYKVWLLVAINLVKQLEAREMNCAESLFIIFLSCTPPGKIFSFGGRGSVTFRFPSVRSFSSGFLSPKGVLIRARI